MLLILWMTIVSCYFLVLSADIHSEWKLTKDNILGIAVKDTDIRDLEVLTAVKVSIVVF
jgi:hypothetical protein